MLLLTNDSDSQPETFNADDGGSEAGTCQLVRLALREQGARDRLAAVLALPPGICSGVYIVK
jgi:hypothetical protein